MKRSKLVLRIYILLLSTVLISPFSIVNASEHIIPPSILVIGDSLSAGYGIPLQEGWVNLLQQRVAQQGFKVINASISGDTSEGALQRLPKLLNTYQPEIVIIEIGGNDGLRGLPIHVIRNNIAHMIELSQQQKSKVLLLGMRIPSNYGARYTTQFAALYAELATQFQVDLVPVFMQNVGDNPELMQHDGIHANTKAQAILLNNTWQVLQHML